ncbi:universal stress protein [Methylocapsa aurea]|uniref:universal stress protein n=1 Tax=Methylocapsa aurea TaxID=663610 RepID=UPI00055C49ED|nr:universal stress protein [Methylocapsa aurea]
MYKHILIPTDGSDLSKTAVQHGVQLAKAVNAKVTGVTVTAPFHIFAVEPMMVTDTPEVYNKHVASRAAKYLGEVKAAALAEGVSCDVLTMERDHPYEAIIEAATDQHCDLIVMASHGRRGISALVLGSETVKVLTHSAIPVLVYR